MEKTMTDIEKIKLAQKKWRDNNREKYLEIQNKASKKYYEENKELVLEKKRLYYLINREKILEKYHSAKDNDDEKTT